MNDERKRRIRDFLQHVDAASIPVVLRRRGEEIVSFAERHLAVTPRTEQSFALQPLASRVGRELISLADAPEDVEHAARAVRNVFETNLIVRYVCVSRENTVHWIQLRVKEEADILCASLILKGGESNPQTLPIRERIAELERYMQERGAAMPAPLPRWKTLAQRGGVEEDYRLLYGVFSKYIHPSAWTIVRPDTSWDRIFANLFLVHAQIYTFDTVARAAETLGVSTDDLERGAWSTAKHR
jgi:hypothetical protein